MSTAQHDHPLLDSLSLTVLSAARTVVSSEWNERAVHRDPYARLYVVMGGVGRITVRGSGYELAAGDLALIPPDTPVVLHRSRGLDHYWMHFTARVAAGLSLFAVFEPPTLIGPDAVSATPGEPYTTGAWPGSAGAIAESAVERLARGASGRFAALTRLRLLLEPFLERGRWSQLTERLTRFYPAIRYIGEHLAEPIRTADLAATAGLHPTYFANQFTAAVGTSPRAYVRARRIDAAQMMLLHTDHPIKAIARDTGFRESAYFCRAFRAATGVAPGAYRARGVV
ncbi:MAG: AraC family transcriptional regulator [Spirochaetaceae bacterium]|nr:MAG: AraC family transcriptional regulator [Spirochaetaceae bacterium]